MPTLRPFVSALWCSVASGPVRGAQGEIAQETMLPSGATHVVFRLGDEPLWIAESANDRPQRLDGGLIGGARSRFYVRASAALSSSVGAVLKPGAVRTLFGVPAQQLAGRHTALADVWGGGSGRLHERLLLATTAADRLDLLEAELLARFVDAAPLHPGIAAALAVFPGVRHVREAVQVSGLSHRHFLVRFREEVGLDPKAFLRVLRFQRATRAMDSATPLAEIALESGYCDQAHMAREFSEMAGLAPSVLRRQRDTAAASRAVQSTVQQGSVQVKNIQDSP